MFIRAGKDMAGKVSIGCTIFILLLSASIADARLWPWPEDFAEVKARRLGDRFITEEEGDSLVKQDLCFDCHDGSVLDNRELWDPGLHGHRVDVVPKQALPQGIPLLEGRLYCGSCHLPHGDLPGARSEVKKPYLRYENTNDVFCVACHQERATPGPQEASRNHSFLKKARTDTATADPEAWQRIQNLGGRVGKGGATRCQSCHRPHGAPSRSALITFVDKSQLCSICHHDIKDSSTAVNHPLHQENPWKVENRPLTVECLTCHRVHEAPVPGILLTEQGEGLCLHCHAKNKLPANDTHREERFTKQTRASSETRGGGNCRACHIPHRAQGKFLAVVVAGASGLDPDSRFCAGCHGSEKGRAENQIGPCYHYLGPWPKETSSGAILPPAERLPLLTSTGMVPETGGKERGTNVGCRTCHFMHDRPEALPADLLLKNLRQTALEGDLCLACHKDRQTILETTHNPLRIEKPEIRARFPVKDRNPCSLCHVVHKAGTRNLFPGPVVLDPDTDPRSAACLSCHGPGTHKAETLVGNFSHPLGPWPTDAEDSQGLYRLPEDLPLVPSPSVESRTASSASKGSVSCFTCHRLHPVKDEERLAKYLRPGSSGRDACTVCHAAQRVLRSTKHYIRAPDTVSEIDRFFGKMDESQECSPCHRVHNARGPGLWFTELPEAKTTFEQDERSRRCLGCHLKEPFKRIREENGHPIGTRMKTQYLPSAEARLQLGRIARDEAGVRDVVVCATCHLNHGKQNPDGTITLFAGGGLPDGELCMVCHREKGQIVGSPHDFRTRKEGEFRPDGGRSLKSGVCAGCHANHNARIGQGLIAFAFSRPKGEGNPEDMFCLYCHRNPAVMRARRIKFYVHPSGTKVKEKLKALKEKAAAPSQERLGEPARTSVAGYEALYHIDCRTCHDNHRWTGLPISEAKELPRTEMASFLRGSDVAKTLCSNCHGTEALYRYRMYHQDRAWRLKIPNE
jgi:predicted CXXCH cytochrome family protein